MNIKYKLTDQDGYTRRGKTGETLWKEGKRVEAIGTGNKLCSNDVIHYYDSVELAVMLNPIHACIDNPILWGIEIEDCIAHDGLKGGCKAATAIRRVGKFPEVPTSARVRFGILCALEVYREEVFVKWAKDWLSNKDRTAAAAHAAAAAAADAAYAAAAAAYAAAHAAAAAAYAAYAAAAAAAGKAAKNWRVWHNLAVKAIKEYRDEDADI